MTADLRSLLALAYIDGLNRRADETAQRAVTALTHTVRLDDTGRPPNVPLHPTQPPQ